MDKDIDAIAREVVDAAIEVHRTLGPGLLESVYAQSQHRELSLRGLMVTTEVPLRANFKGIEFDAAYRLDMFVEDAVVIELKVVENLSRLHKAQLLSYLRMSGHELGLLMNFNTPLLKEGLLRLANNP